MADQILKILINMDENFIIGVFGVAEHEFEVEFEK
jgi:hypothetical protein